MCEYAGHLKFTGLSDEHHILYIESTAAKIPKFSWRIILYSENS